MKQFTILLFLISVNCFSQIQIEKPDNKLENNEPLTPLTNYNIDLKEYRSAEQFLGLIGKELFYLPENPKYSFPKGYESISYLPKKKLKLNKVKYKSNILVQLRGKKDLFNYLNIAENYFVVDSIQFYYFPYFVSNRGRMNGKEFNKKAQKYTFTGSVDIYTHHKISNEIIIFNKSSQFDLKELISVSYFNYLTKKYLDKDVIIFTGVDHFDRMMTINKIKKFDRKFLDSTLIFKVVKIVKIALKEGVKIYTEQYYVPLFSLEDSENNIEEVSFDKIKDKVTFLEDFNIGADLKEKQDLIKKDSLEKVRVAATKLKNEQVELKKDKNEEARTKRLITLAIKYGIDLGETIAKNKISIGMTKEMCRDSWGKPNSINRTTNKYGTSEQWVYSRGRYLYFDKEKLTTVQN